MQRNADTREAVFDAFATLIIARPYAMISLSDVYEAAGVSKGQFYTMFDSREAAAIGLAQFEFDKALEDVGARLRHLDPSIELLVAAMFEATAHLIDRPRFHAAILLQAEIGRNAELPFHDIDRWRDFLHTQLRHAAAAGDVPGDLDLDGVADFVLAAWAGARNLSDLASGLADIVDRITNIVRFVVAAIVVPDRQDYVRTFVERYAHRVTP